MSDAQGAARSHAASVHSEAKAEAVEESTEWRDADEIQECLRRMRAASSAFYSAAVRTGNHAFIEFTGLMNEYIKVCDDAARDGLDFRFASRHTGEELPFQDYHVVYLNEKLGCIYQGLAFAARMKDSA